MEGQVWYLGHSFCVVVVVGVCIRAVVQVYDPVWGGGGLGSTL